MKPWGIDHVPQVKDYPKLGSRSAVPLFPVDPEQELPKAISFENWQGVMHCGSRRRPTVIDPDAVTARQAAIRIVACIALRVIITNDLESCKARQEPQHWS